MFAPPLSAQYHSGHRNTREPRDDPPHHTRTPTIRSPPERSQRCGYRCACVMNDARKTKAHIEELEVSRGEVTDLREKVAGVDVSGVERQLAAERVRAAAMEMRGTDDLRKVVRVLFGEMQRLDIDSPRACTPRRMAGSGRNRAWPWDVAPLELSTTAPCLHPKSLPTTGATTSPTRSSKLRMSCV